MRIVVQEVELEMPVPTNITGPTDSENWRAKLDDAMREASLPDDRQAAWRLALEEFIAAFRKHPASIHPWEMRHYFYHRCEVGGVPGLAPGKSFALLKDALNFFYQVVLPIPELEAVARHPFPMLGIQSRKDWVDAWLDTLSLDLLAQGLDPGLFERHRPGLKSFLIAQGREPHPGIRDRISAFLLVLGEPWKYASREEWLRHSAEGSFQSHILKESDWTFL